jgi:uncharacterized membrane protein YgcG
MIVLLYRRADTVLELFEVVQTAPLAFPDQPPVSPELRHLLLGMLEKVGGWVGVCVCLGGKRGGGGAGSGGGGGGARVGGERDGGTGC